MARVSTQPQYVTRQPPAYGGTGNPFQELTGEWSVGLMDCCDDTSECFYAYCCSCCFMNALANDIDEKATCGCCIPNRVAVYRMKVRSILRIRGSAMDDCCVVCFCGFCAALQMKLELKKRGLAQ